MGNIPVTTTTKIFPKVLRYKWEAYCNTNGRRTAIQMGGVLTVFPFPQSVGAPEVLRYKSEAYCNTNGRCIAILFWEVVVVGVSDILLKKLEVPQVQLSVSGVKSGTNLETPWKRSQSKFWVSRFRTVGDPQTLENKADSLPRFNSELW